MIFMISAGEFPISDPFLRKFNSKKVPFPAAHTPFCNFDFFATPLANRPYN